MLRAPGGRVSGACVGVPDLLSGAGALPVAGDPVFVERSAETRRLEAARPRGQPGSRFGTGPLIRAGDASQTVWGGTRPPSVHRIAVQRAGSARTCCSSSTRNRRGRTAGLNTGATRRCAVRGRIRLQALVRTNSSRSVVWPRIELRTRAVTAWLCRHPRHDDGNGGADDGPGGQRATGQR